MLDIIATADLTTLAEVLSWWVALYYTCLGFYLVALAEYRCPIFGFAAGIFGVLVYMLVNFPPWLPELPPRVLIIITLLTTFAMGVLAARVVWMAYDLSPPHQRLLHVYRVLREVLGEALRDVLRGE